MRQTRLMWLAFMVAVAVVLASMGWATRTVQRLDAAEADSRRRAQFEENVRLALWRMDSALAPLIAAEHARPAGAFAAPVSAPIPGTQIPFVAAYFRYTPGGAVPTRDDGRQTTAPLGADPLESLGPYDRLIALLPPPAAAAPAPEPEAIAQVPVKGGKQQRSYQEYQARAANTQQQVEVQSNLNRSVYDLGPADVTAGPLRPLWAGDQLVPAASTGRRSVRGSLNRSKTSSLPPVLSR